MTGTPTVPAGPRERGYTLLGPDALPYRSTVPGTLGGHRRTRLYGRLDCPSALRAIARGHYVKHRVFFADEATAVAAGYRPCAVCLPARYTRWKATRGSAGTTMITPVRPQRTGSPLLRTAQSPGARLASPAAHTDAELAALAGLLTRPGARIEILAVGHGRDEASREAARAVTEAWTARGGQVAAVVSWPEEAASWLRPATRLTTPRPDAWVMAASPLGFAQLARRLRHSTDWDPARTFAFASLQDVRLPELAGPGVLDGLRGATADGGTWEVDERGVTVHPRAGTR
ncbi:Ada metal-binding domain-containing protein [Spirillospora sp. NPDC049652]